MTDERRHAAAAERNREPILDVLRRVLPRSGLVLEVASGTGQHTAHFAAALPELQWQPSERDPEMLGSIAAWTRDLGNVRPPILLDVTAESWSVAGALDAVFNANMIHIAPWPVCLALLRGAALHLTPGGVLVMYGPYRIGGRHTADSNDAFDRRLRDTDPSWGVRDLEAVCEAAAAEGLSLVQRFEMPANNQTLLFRRLAKPH
jgi:SAM-dependent methyltransferase